MHSSGFSFGYCEPPGAQQEDQRLAEMLTSAFFVMPKHMPFKYRNMFLIRANNEQYLIRDAIL